MAFLLVVLCFEIEECKEVSCQNEAISFVFGNIEEKSALTDWPEYASKRAVLAWTNNIVNQINDKCLEQLAADVILLPGISRTVNIDDATHYTSKYIDQF